MNVQWLLYVLTTYLILPTYVCLTGVH